MALAGRTRSRRGTVLVSVTSAGAGGIQEENCRLSEQVIKMTGTEIVTWPARWGIAALGLLAAVDRNRGGVRTRSKGPGWRTSGSVSGRGRRPASERRIVLACREPRRGPRGGGRLQAPAVHNRRDGPGGAGAAGVSLDRHEGGRQS